MMDSFNSWNAPLNTHMNTDYHSSDGSSSTHSMAQLGTQWNGSDTSSPDDGPRVFTTNWDEYDSYRCGTPDLDELKLAIEDAKERRQEHREQSRKDQNIHLAGIGSLLCQLRGEVPHEEVMAEEMNHIDLNGTGEIIDETRTRRQSKAKYIPLTDPDEIRRRVRSKMPRCKVCRSRFGERNLLERHLRDHHHVEYLEYIAKQEEEIQLQQLQGQELNRLEELQSGAFIPPENELASASFDIDVNSIPLPGENTNGIVPRFPQCNFCDEIFPNEVSLKRHLLENHPESIEFVQCLDCFKCLPRREDLLNHDCDLTFMCYECVPMRNLCSGVRLLPHRVGHRGDNSGFPCNLCNLKFLTPRLLRKHKIMDHDLTTTYYCHFCNELFTSEVSVITHERMHTGIDEYVCSYCDFRCNRFLKMDDHKIKEHGDLLFSFGEYFAQGSEMRSGFLTSDSESDTSIIESPRVWVTYLGYVE